MIKSTRYFILIGIIWFQCNQLKAQFVSEMNAAYYMSIRGINYDTFNTVGVFGQGNTGIMGQSGTKFGYGVYGICTGSKASGV